MFICTSYISYVAEENCLTSPAKETQKHDSLWLIYDRILNGPRHNALTFASSERVELTFSRISKFGSLSRAIFFSQKRDLKRLPSTFLGTRGVQKTGGYRPAMNTKRIKLLRRQFV